MSRLIKAVMLALAIAALAGCSGTTVRRDAPGVTFEKTRPTTTFTRPQSVAPVSTPVPSKAEQPSSASRPAKKPSEYTSLQPFKKFKKGEGEGVAREYKDRTKAQFIALFRDSKLAKKEMRVACDVLVRQMAEAHPEFPSFEGCEGAAAAIASDDYQIIACKDSMFLKDNFLAVTNENGTAWGAWHRKCLPGEKVLAYKGTPLISTMCLNVSVPVTQAPPPSASPPPAKKLVPAPTAVCPKGIILFANAWTMDSIYAASNDLGKRVDALIAAATKRDSENASNVKAYMANDVSGGNIGDGVSENIGDEIIRVVNVRAPLGIDIQVNLLDPVTTKVVEDLGRVSLVDGIAKIYLTEAQRAYIVETIWPAWFSSPTVSGGERRIWVPPGAWKKKGGQNWHWCTLQKNAAYWKVNRP